MVTLVNEFSPACAPQTFHVREDAGPHTLLGSVVGTDLDHPHNSIEYYASGGPATFAVDRLSGTATQGLVWRARARAGSEAVPPPTPSPPLPSCLFQGRYSCLDIWTMSSRSYTGWLSY